MNTPEYRILKAGNTQELQNLVNQAITTDNKDVTVLGGMCVAVYEGYPPLYYQAILIKDAIDEKLLLEKFGIVTEDSTPTTIITENSQPIIKSEKKKRK